MLITYIDINSAYFQTILNILHILYNKILLNICQYPLRYKVLKKIHLSFISHLLLNVREIIFHFMLLSSNILFFYFC